MVSPVFYLQLNANPRRAVRAALCEVQFQALGGRWRLSWLDRTSKWRPKRSSVHVPMLPGHRVYPQCQRSRLKRYGLKGKKGKSSRESCFVRWSFERSRDGNLGQEKPFMGAGDEPWVILEGARQSLVNEKLVRMPKNSITKTCLQ